jgi:hypothetical protein
VNGQAAGLTVREQELGPALVEMNVLRAELQMSNAKMLFVIQVIFLLHTNLERFLYIDLNTKDMSMGHSVGPVIWTYCLLITY